ncbi:AIF1 [Acanthosepion pharaonis]|uniref:AIF1 n=1 Tax=Acanthosepion pharaonis TaxID=158019 RepID=A0A812CKA7_ACAPH|nr:AIF1 [Sepia pharaonis]
MENQQHSILVDLPKGGKAYGMLKDKQDTHLSRINQQFLDDIAYCDVEDLEEKLISYKRQFVQFDEDASGDLNIMDVKRMMEKLGQAKTHLELKKMIAEVDRTGTGVITYQDFVLMMLGKKSSILKLILMFEEKNKPKEIPKGPPPKRDLSALP